MSDVHEQLEYADHAKHAANTSKHIALLIAILSLFLSLSEMLGKSANTEAITLNIKVSDTWNFFQAKNIRRTVVMTAAEPLKAAPPLSPVSPVTLAAANGATGTTGVADPSTPSTPPSAIERQIA